MTIQEIIDYVVHTPENSNPAVLKSMLEQLGSTSSAADSTITANGVEVPVIYGTIDYTTSEDIPEDIDT